MKKHHVKVSFLCITQVKQKRGIIERGCCKKLKDEDIRQSQFLSEKEEIIEERFLDSEMTMEKISAKMDVSVADLQTLINAKL